MKGTSARHGSGGQRPRRQMRYLALALLLTAGILARALGMAPGLPNLRGFSGSGNAQAAGLAANAGPIAPPPPQGACPTGNGLFVLYYGYIQNPASTDPTLQMIVAGQPNFVVVGDGLGGRSDIPAYLHQSGVRAIQYVPLNYAAAPAATVDAAIDTAMGSGYFYRAVEIAPSSFLPTGVANVVVTGNQIAMGSTADPSSSLSQSLIRLDTSGLPIGAVRITNNVLSNAVYGVSLTAAAAQSTKVTISGNTTQNVFAPQVIYG